MVTGSPLEELDGARRLVRSTRDGSGGATTQPGASGQKHKADLKCGRGRLSVVDWGVESYAVAQPNPDLWPNFSRTSESNVSSADFPAGRVGGIRSRRRIASQPFRAPSRS